MELAAISAGHRRHPARKKDGGTSVRHVHSGTPLSPAEKPLVHAPTAREVADALLRSGAYLVRAGAGPDQFFDWKARPKFAPVYMDLLKLGGAPAAMQAIVRGFEAAMRERFAGAELVVGLAEAGLLFSPVIAHNLSLPHAFVRKAEKKHGLPGRVAGCPPRGARAVLIDDLVASGTSIAEAVTVLREEAPVTVVGVLSVVNWNFATMRDALHGTGDVCCLVSYAELLNAAVELGILTPDAEAELTAFYANPWTHEWNLAALAGRG